MSVAAVSLAERQRALGFCVYCWLGMAALIAVVWLSLIHISEPTRPY